MMGENFIRKAARRLPGHWVKGTMGAGQGARDRCGLGHLLAVTGYGEVVSAEEISKMRNVMSLAAMDKFPDRTGEWLGMDWRDARFSLDNCPFAAFNDNERTTESDVLQVMELAAERWDVERG